MRGIYAKCIQMAMIIIDWMVIICKNGNLTSASSLVGGYETAMK